MTAADPFGDLIQQAHEDGFRHGLGVAIRTLDAASKRIGDDPHRGLIDPAAVTRTMLSGIADILREESASFTMGTL